MKTKQISSVDMAYIRMATTCVKTPEIKQHLERQLVERCPLNAPRIITIIKTAKGALSHDEYKRLEADVLSAIKEEEIK